MFFFGGERGGGGWRLGFCALRHVYAAQGLRLLVERFRDPKPLKPKPQAHYTQLVHWPFPVSGSKACIRYVFGDCKAILLP